MILIFSSQQSYGQRWKRLRKEILGGILTSQFLGDLGGGKGIGVHDIRDFNLKAIRYGGCIGYSYRLGYHFAWQTKFIFAYLYGNDKFSKEAFRNNRNLNFRSPVIDFTTQCNYIFFNKKREFHRYNIKGITPKNIIDYQLYVFTGIGGFWFDPYGRDSSNQWHRLKPLRTEGEGLVPSRKEYSNFQVCIPIGVGIKFALNRLYSLGIEYSYRKTFTDYIDDCSTTYFDPAAIKDANNKNGDLAVYMANPSPTKNLSTSNNPNGITSQTTAPGMQRGDPRNKDGYMFLIVSLYYKLPRKGFLAPKF